MKRTNCHEKDKLSGHMDRPIDTNTHHISLKKDKKALIDEIMGGGKGDKGGVFRVRRR